MTLKEFYKKYEDEIDNAIKNALEEDSVFNDITTNAILTGSRSKKIITAKLLCKENCIAAGLDIFKRVYLMIDPHAQFKFYVNDGDLVRNKQIAAEVKSSLRNLLAGERTALNFLQRMSGIATLTNHFVKKLKYKEAKILHTRKTTPNFRIFELAAVKIGGGDFHRINLSSAVLVKDNHIQAAGSVENAIKILKQKAPQKGKKIIVEIEAKTDDEINSIIRNGRSIINTVMLDNFDVSHIESAAMKLKKNGFIVELSGGINKQNFVRKQRKGIDYYSIGMLTHSYKSMDFSLEF